MNDIVSTNKKRYSLLETESYNKLTGVTSAAYYPGSVTETFYRNTGPNYPDWRDRLERNEDATTYLNASREWSKIELGEYRNIPGPNWTSSITARMGDMEAISYVTYDSDIQSLLQASDNQAKKALLRKAAEVTNQFQGYTFLGELGELLHGLRHPARALRRGVDDYVWNAQKHVRKVKNVTKANDILAETWLEYVFGWAPFISDVKSGAEALSRYNNNWYGEGKRITAFGNAEKMKPWSTSTRSVGYCRYQYSTSRKLSATTVYRSHVECSPADRLTMARNLFGFRWEDFVPAVWEVIPYSFLIDYFTNIGDVISAWSHQNFERKWINRTQIYTIDNHISSMYIDYALLETRKSQGLLSGAYLRPYRCHRYYRNVERDSYSGSLIPSFEFELPGIGSLKWLNIGALFGLKARRGLAERRERRRVVDQFTKWL